MEEEKYAEVLMALIEAYEEEHHTISDAPPVEVLRTLMDANNLRQKDLAPIFGSERMVSEVLHKKRELSKSQIEKLSKRFRVFASSVFFRTSWIGKGWGGGRKLAGRLKPGAFMSSYYDIRK
jgi:HTH-type transcriptional regulator/antitoxin HigA